MDKKATKSGDGSLAEALLIRRALLGESLSSAEWATVSAELLGAGAILLLGRFLELGLMAIDHQMRQKNEIEAEFRKLITDKSRDLDEQMLEAIENSPRAAELLTEAKLNRAVNRTLSREIGSRAVDHALSTVVMMIARFEPSRTDLTARMIQQALRIDSLEDYRFPDDSADLRQDATLGAVEKLDEIWQQGWNGTVEATKVPTEAPRMFSPTLESSRWNRAEIYRMAAVWLGSGLAAIFAGDPRALPQATRDRYREIFEQRDAQKRGGTGGRHAKAAEGQKRPIIVSFDDLRESEQPSAPVDPQSGLAERIVAVAREHLGSKAARYFEEIARGATQQAAAGVAGISDRMGRKYQRQMRKLLSARYI
jgi:hypothetical protein